MRPTCEFCGYFLDGDRCPEKSCPKNPRPDDDPALMKLIRDEMIRENLRWNGLPIPEALPTFGASKVYVSDLWRYVRAALVVVRSAQKLPPGHPFPLPESS